MPPELKILTFPSTKPKAKPHASGLFRLHFRYQDPITGVLCEKDVYGKTLQLAEKKKRAFLRQIEQGVRATDTTLEAWARSWLTVYKKPSVSANTYTSYCVDVEHIIRSIGNMQLKNITQQDIVRLMSTRIGLSASAIKKTYMTVNALMESAINNRLITYNPCRGVTIPSGTIGTHRALTNDEIRLVLSVADDGHRFALPVLLMLFAGLRRGEAAAFHKRDVSDSIRVSKSLAWTGNAPVVNKPKTAAGVRIIPILSPLDKYLRFEGYAAKSTSNPGKPITLQAFERGFESFLTACEEKLNGCTKRWQPEDHVWQSVAIRCHDLRHTFATMLYDAGVDIKTAQRWLGHSDPAITMKIYTHLSQTKHDSAQKKASIFFKNISSGGKTGGIGKKYKLKSQ